MKIYKIRSKNTGLFSNGLNYCNSSGYYSSFNEFGFDALGKCWASVESLKRNLSKMLKEAPVYIYNTLEIVEYSLKEEEVIPSIYFAPIVVAKFDENL